VLAGSYRKKIMKTNSKKSFIKFEGRAIYYLSQYFQRVVWLRDANPTYFNLVCLNSCITPFFILTLVFLATLNVSACSSSSLLGIVKQPENIVNSTTNSTNSNSTFGLFDISTFDVYLENKSIHLLVGGKVSANDKQVKISYTKSEDDGYSWTNPISLNNFPTSINTPGNDVQLAAKGKHLLAIWQTKGELPGMGPMVSDYSEDGGLNWKQGTNPAIYNAGDQSHADLIADQHGRFHAVWLEDPEENGYQSLRYARTIDNGKQWNQTKTLDDSTCSCCWNTFALSPENELNILYRDMKPRDMALLTSSDSGKTWQRLSTVGEFNWKFDGCPHVGGGLAYSQINGLKRLHSLVWTGVDQKAGLYYLASENNGTSWSMPKKMGNAAIHGDIASVDGTVMAIWDEMEADGSGIFYEKSEDSGLTWLAATRLTDANTGATHPRIVATRQGFLAVWTEKPNKQSSHLAWQLIK
jgi:hypothetical protein